MCSGHSHGPTVGKNHLTQCLFFNEVLNISCHVLNRGDRKWKTEWLPGCGTAVSVVVVYPMITWLAGRPGSRSLSSIKRERIVLHIPSPGKDQNSNSEVRFLLNVYCFRTIMKSKKSWVGDHLYSCLPVCLYRYIMYICDIFLPLNSTDKSVYKIH